MASTYYSDIYTADQSGNTYTAEVPSVARPGEPVWIRATCVIPTSGRASGDVVKIAPVPAGLRPVGGYVGASGTNGSLTVDLGWTSDPDAILADSTAFQAAGATAFTAANLKAVSNLSVQGDDLIATLGGTVGSTATTFEFLIALANVGS
jgi:hypothetical protein